MHARLGFSGIAPTTLAAGPDLTFGVKVRRIGSVGAEAEQTVGLTIT